MAEPASRTPSIGQSDDPGTRCGHCGKGMLGLVEEWPHPLFGVLGVTCQKFRCDARLRSPHEQPVAQGGRSPMDVQPKVWVALIGALGVAAILAPLCWRWWCNAQDEAFERKLFRRTWLQSRERQRRLRRRSLKLTPPNG